MNKYSFRVPLYCLGSAVGAANKHGGLIRVAEPLEPKSTDLELYLLEFEFSTEQYEDFSRELEALINDGPGIRPYCSFCGKSKAETKHLIRGASPEITICDECVNECVRIINEENDT